MQIIDVDSWTRRILSEIEAERLHAGIVCGRLAINLAEVMDLDGDLVLEGRDFHDYVKLLEGAE